MGHVLWRVATATGQPVQTVAQGSYALAVWQYARLLDVERIEGALQQFDRLHDADATRMAMAQDSHKVLKRARDELVRRYAVGGGTDPEAAESALARIRRARRRARKRKG